MRKVRAVVVQPRGVDRLRELWLARVEVDDHHLVAGLRERERQVRGHGALAVARGRARDQHRAPGAVALDLGGQGAHGLERLGRKLTGLAGGS
jgi:hypothetical protein